MEMAKVTSKGQITIPISIRRRLDIHEGDKLLFLERPNGFMMVNPSTYQEEIDNEISAAPAPIVTERSPTANTSTTHDGSKQYAPSVGRNGSVSGSGDYDVAAMLNEIRSMGAKI